MKPFKKEQVTAVATVTVVDAACQDADALLSIAKRHPEKASLLLGCSVVVLATTLDQGIRTVLSSKVAEWAIEEGTDSNNPYTALLKQCFRLRMLQAAELLTENKFQLNPDCHHTKALHDLITLRNELAHVYDEPVVMKGTDQRLTLEGDMFKLTLPVPKSPWTSVTTQMATKYREAVIAYMSEILGFQNGSRKCAELLIPKEAARS